MFAANYKLNPKVETIFLMSQPKYSFLSSSVVKEIAFYGGHIEDMVTPAIAEAIKKHIKSRTKN